MTSFTAINVNVGDAFYLDTGTEKILVDGGMNKNEFPKKLKKATSGTNLRTVVCTHGDIDHTNGIIGLLENKSVSCKEAWLPGIWTDQVRNLLDEPDKFLRRLEENIANLDQEELPNSLPKLGDSIFEESYQYKSSESEEGIEKEQIRIWLEEHKEGLFPFPTVGMNISNYNRIKHKEILSRKDLFLSSILTVASILEIIKKAIQNGVTIRWFEYGKPFGKGGEDYLEPVNSHEIERIKINQYTREPLKFVALTASNKLSLVFKAPLQRNEPPVLFSADSNFDFPKKISFKDGMLITVPHHGSGENTKIYEDLDNLNKKRDEEIKPVWVRSDKKQAPASRPCEEFLEAVGTKYCTKCSCLQEQQNVRLKIKNGQWAPDSNTVKCLQSWDL